jgi:hypothetical protein
MEKKIIYHITYWEIDLKIGETIVDILNAELIWKIFKQFGHTRTENTTFEVRESFEEV